MVRINRTAIGGLFLLGWLVAGHPADLRIALLDLGLAAWTFVPSRVARTRGLSDAATLLALGVLTAVAIAAFAVTFHPVLLVAPLLAAVVAVPFADFRAMRVIGLLAWLTTLIVIVRAQLLPLTAEPNVMSAPAAQIMSVGLVTALGLYFTLHSTERIRDALAASRRSEEELRATSDLLREQRQLLASIIEGTTDLVYLKDTEGRYRLMNEATRRWLDRPLEALLGRTDADLVDEETWRQTQAADRAVLESGESTTSEQTVTVGGVTRIFHTTKGVYRDPDGATAGLFGISRDITDQKRTEEQLRQAQKMEAVGRLAGGIAHDFNNLLTAITGYSQLALDGLRATDPVCDEVREIQRSADRAAGLTRQLLAFSRRQVLQPEVLDPNAIVTDIAAMLRRLIPENIELRVVRGPNVGRVLADPHQLEQVIVNLAVNARDAMPDGGCLTIETADAGLAADDLRGRDAAPGGSVTLTVSDTGVGMDPATMEHLFEPFFSTKEPGQGTGLGLAQVYGTIRQSGGTIEVHSERGVGSTFTIHLPRVDEPLPQRLRPVDAAPDTTARGTVLLVEDDPTVRALVSSVLARSGHRVLTAASGEEALRIVERDPGALDVLLSDIVMAGLSGPALATAARDLRPGLPVLLMSGYPEHALSDGGAIDAEWAFIAKPFTPAQLRERLDATLRGARTAPEPARPKAVLRRRRGSEAPAPVAL